MRRPASILVALLLPVAVFGAACGGDDGGEENGSGGTDSTVTTQGATTTTEAVTAEINGDWVMTQTLTESAPPDVVPVDIQTLELPLALTLGDCPTETTAEGPDAAAVASVTPVTDAETCVGSADWGQRNDNLLVGVPLLLEGDTYSMSATIVQPCVDDATGEVQSPTGGTSERTLTFTVAEGAGGATVLQGEQTAVNALDPAACDPPVDTFAAETTFAVEAVLV